MNETIFKAYDIRGIYPEEINETTVERIGGAYANFVKPKTVVVGSDVRLSSPTLKKSLITGLIKAGVNVIDIGTGPTELVYFAVGSLKVDGGVQVSASHNPAEYNGLKMVRSGVQAISSDSGLLEIKELALSGKQFIADNSGTVTNKDLTPDYINFLATQVDLSELPRLKIVANNNFGTSGSITERVLQQLDAPVELIKLNFNPDGSFPKGRPDPLISSNQKETGEVVKTERADLAVAWDADGDRCYIADENGDFIEGCYMTALLAQRLLARFPGEKILYDPRNIWAIERTVRAAGGIPIMTRAGHTFIKERMKSEGALFAGEMSGHYYYRNFFSADNGILTFLYFLEIIAQTKAKVSVIAQPFRDKFFVSGEVNFRVSNIKKTIDEVRSRFPAAELDTTDGISLSFDDWRFNVRSSSTEPLLRLNIEAETADLCQSKTEELREIIKPYVVGDSN